jgi:hypothetical protein
MLRISGLDVNGQSISNEKAQLFVQPRMKRSVSHKRSVLPLSFHHIIEAQKKNKIASCSQALHD